MNISVIDKTGQKKEEMAVPSVFDVKVSPKLVTLYINYLRAALRSPIANTKDRGEVRGGGRKPWKQKGTGNARVGSIRSPLWVGGGVVFGPTNERNFHLRMNRRERQLAMAAIFNNLLSENKVIVLEESDLSSPKTKEAVQFLSNIGAQGKVAVILPESLKNAWLGLRNIAGIAVMAPGKIDPIYLFSADKVVISRQALESLEKNLAKKAPVAKKPKEEEAKSE